MTAKNEKIKMKRSPKKKSKIKKEKVKQAPSWIMFAGMSRGQYLKWKRKAEMYRRKIEKVKEG
jgi:hypothetical protein